MSWWRDQVDEANGVTAEQPVVDSSYKLLSQAAIDDLLAFANESSDSGVRCGRLEVVTRIMNLRNKGRIVRDEHTS